MIFSKYKVIVDDIVMVLHKGNKDSSDRELMKQIEKNRKGK